MVTRRRYSRQQDLVNQEALNQHKPLIIGVGAIGRNVVLQLASIGVQELTIVDHDRVDESNVSSQGFRESQIGMPKTQALHEDCVKINETIQVRSIPHRFSRGRDKNDVVFVCVDSIDVRGFIWTALGDDSKFLIDGRMSAETMRVITADSEENRKYYPRTLFREEEVEPGRCTAKTTIYCANIAAGFMVSSFTKWLREIPNERDISLNLISMDMFSTPEEVL